MIKFQFRAFKTEKLGVVYRPFADIRLINGNYDFKDEFLIDSGADITMIPKSVGDRLHLPEIEKEEISPLSRIGGLLPVVYRNIEIEIGNYRLGIRVAWAQSERAPLLLGRADVFDFFKIEFDQSEKVTTSIKKRMYPQGESD